MIVKNQEQQLFTIDVARGKVIGKSLYPLGIIQSVAGYTMPAGAHVVFAGLEPDPAAPGTGGFIVVVDPLKAWEPTVVLQLEPGFFPMQGGATIAGDTLFMLIRSYTQENAQQIVIGDISQAVPVFRKVHVDLSCCPFGVGAFGGPGATPSAR